MARFTGLGPSAIEGQTDDIHSEKKHPLGTRAFDKDGNEYIYLQGVASGAQYAFVSFDEAFVTSLLAANAKGRVAILQAALDATTKYGWGLIYGTGSGKVLASFADNGLVYCTATAGSVDDAVVAGDLVVGAIGRSAISNGLATMELNYPFVTDALG